MVWIGGIHRRDGMVWIGGIHGRDGMVWIGGIHRRDGMVWYGISKSREQEKLKGAGTANPSMKQSCSIPRFPPPQPFFLDGARSRRSS